MKKKSKILVAGLLIFLLGLFLFNFYRGNNKKLDNLVAVEDKKEVYFFEDTDKVLGHGMDCSVGTYAPSAGVCYGVATVSGTEYIVNTPDTSNLYSGDNKFIGWAQDDDGRDIDCSSDNLVKSNTVKVSGRVSYYACYEEIINDWRKAVEGSSADDQEITCGSSIFITSCYKNGDDSKDEYCYYKGYSKLGDKEYPNQTGIVKRDYLRPRSSAIKCDQSQSSSSSLSSSSSSTTQKYSAKFDYNGGTLKEFSSKYFDETIEDKKEYALKYVGKEISIDGINESYKKNTDTNKKMYIMYWSTDHLCKDANATKVAVGQEGSLAKNSYSNDKDIPVYYACYEEEINDNRWVSNQAIISGDTNLTCGDGIYVTTCYKAKAQGDEKPENYCDYNWVSSWSKNDEFKATGTVKRDYLEPNYIKNCTTSTNYTVTFYEDSYASNGKKIDGKGLSCSNNAIPGGGGCQYTGVSGSKITLPNTSKLKYGNKKFIGWASSNTGKSVNCTGDLITSSSFTIKENATYYACYENDVVNSSNCESSKEYIQKAGSITEYDIKVCYNAVEKSNGELKTTPIEDDYDEILTCAKGYVIDEVSTTNITENTCTKEGICYKTYKLRCVPSNRPGVSATSVNVGDDNTGIINYKGVSDFDIIGCYANESYKKPSSITKWEDTSNGKCSYEGSPGSVFLWVQDENELSSYAAMASIIDKVNVDTTAKNIEIKDASGKTLNTTKYAYDFEISDGITSSDYVRLSNEVKNDSKILATGFNPFDTAYKVTTSSDKIAVYATLTSNDASYIEGYEPRTVDLDYGINTILIKIKNNKGKTRTYTIIATRKDDRDSSNLLKSLSVSEGKLDFDALSTDYVVSVPKNKETVNINAELSSLNASYVVGFGPRTIILNDKSTTALIKVQSETGSIRTYSITFIKTNTETSENKEALLSSLSLSKAYVAFDKNTFTYNTSVDYEVASIDVYALAVNGGDSVKLYKNDREISSENIILTEGSNSISIVVSNNDGNSNKYILNILRKENGLEISNDSSLSMLDVKGYDINFKPDKDYYEVKIKSEKTLLISATPNNNRSEIYIRGNDNLTAFSTVRVKVVAENGESKEYTLDIKKDKFNQKIEIIGLVSGLIIIICGIIVIRVKKNKKSINDYYAE